MKRPLTWKLDCVFLDKFYGHLNVGIFPDIPIGTRWVFPVLWKNMSLKAHGGCSMLSLFFQENVSSQFLFLSFTPLCHLAALLLCLWHHEILWVLSRTIVAIVDMVDIQLSCAFISIIEPSQPAETHPFQTYARHERNRYEFPHMHLAKVRPDSSTHHQLSKILNIASWQDMFSIACLQCLLVLLIHNRQQKTVSLWIFVHY